jgi:hypothetical protein
MPRPVFAAIEAREQSVEKSQTGHEAQLAPVLNEPLSPVRTLRPPEMIRKRPAIWPVFQPE